MYKKIFTLITLFVSTLLATYNANAQCQANFSVNQDTTIGAPAHTYIGENLCQGANFLGVDTINYTYTWTWGDGSATTAPFPSHTYANTGNYTICVLMQGVAPATCNDTMCINAAILKDAAMATINFKKPGVVASVKDYGATFMIYPNPVRESGLIKINGLQDKNATIAVYSIDGKFIYNPSFVIDNYVDVSNLAIGNYVLKITSNNKTSSVKFAKQ